MPGSVAINRRLPNDLRQQTGSGTDVQSRAAAPSYYDIPILQHPVWEGRYIGTYFFLGGLSGGAYLTGRMAELFGGRDFEQVARAGTTAAMLAALPCAPLLIADLGDWRRFHHMLRVFKPQSPMNFGSWVFTGYNGAAAAAVLREVMKARRGGRPPHTPAGQVADKSLALVTDLAGIPLALLMTSYTGVLLSGTATPTWCRNKWLAPLFSASAIGNGAGAISLILHFLNRHHWFRGETRAQRAVSKVESAAHIAEIICLIQYLTSLGRLRKPLTSGKDAKFVYATLAGFVASEVLKHAPLSGQAGRWARIASSALGTMGGFVLKQGILAAGKTSAADPELNRISSTPGEAPAYIHEAQRRTQLPPYEQPARGDAPVTAGSLPR